MNSAKEKHDFSGRIPFVVGVTGHRDTRPEDLPRLEEEIRRIIHSIRRRHPHTPVLLLSALAEGADRIAAKVGLEAGVEFIVPLPVPPEDYELDFSSEESKIEFRKLLSSAHGSFVVEPEMIRHLVNLPVEGMSERDHAYARTGLFVALHSHLLLALWDGKPGEHPAGTAQIVRFRLQGSHTLISEDGDLSAVDEIGDVVHIHTPRSSQLDSLAHISKTQLMMGNQDLHQSENSNQIPRHKFLDDFNRDIQLYLPHHRRSLASSKAALFLEDQNWEFHGKLPIETMNVFAGCDTLATIWRNAYESFLRWMFIIAGGTFALFEIYAHLFPEKPWLLGLFLAGLTLSGTLLLKARFQDIQRKYLDYRALAEGLRIQFYWSQFGIKDDLSSHYLGSHSSELEWIRKAIRVMKVMTFAKSTPGEESCVTGPIITHWLKSQHEYFSFSAIRLHKKEKLYHAISTWSFGVGLLLTGLLWAGHSYLPSSHWEHGAIVGIALLIAGSAFLHGYSQKLAFPELSKQYARMANLFSRANKAIKNEWHQDRIPHLIHVLRNTGIEALSENGDWVLLHRARPLEIPKA